MMFWKEPCPEAHEETPTDGMLVSNRDHHIHPLYCTPVQFYIQETVETLTYGSEFVAAHLATESALEYRYTIRMIVYELHGPIIRFGDHNVVYPQ